MSPSRAAVFTAFASDAPSFSNSWRGSAFLFLLPEMRPVGLPDCPLTYGIAGCNYSAAPLLLILAMLVQHDKHYTRLQYVNKFTLVHASLRAATHRHCRVIQLPQQLVAAMRHNALFVAPDCVPPSATVCSTQTGTSTLLQRVTTHQSRYV
jgi:hypothetical protein